MNPVFQISEGRITTCICVIGAILLAAATFGSLSGHLFEGDDFEVLSDAAAAWEDLSHLLSADRSLPGRPTAEIVFLLTQVVWGNNPAAYHTLLVGLHLAASLLLACTFRRLGVDLELSLLGALFFLMNVAHFRAVHWIACLGYPLAMIFGLIALLGYLRFLESGNRRWLAGSAVVLGVAVLAHSSALSVALFCIYLNRRRGGTIRAVAGSTWPLVGVSLVLVTILYTLYSGAPQAEAAALAFHPDPVQSLQKLLWFLGLLLRSAFWLVPDLTTPSVWDLGAGVLVLGGVLALCVRRAFPIADWGVWCVLATLPFILNPYQTWYAGGPSRYLYLSSAGSSLVLAWVLRSAVCRAERWLSPGCRRVVFVGVLVGLTVCSFLSLKRAEAITFYMSGRAYVARQEIEVGAEQFRRAVLQAPHAAPSDTYIRLASFLLSRGKSPRTILETALDDAPDSPQLNLLLGITYSQSTDPEVRREGDSRVRRVLADSEKDLHLRSDAAFAYQNLATYYHDSERYPEAERLYMEALRLKPDYPTALYNLGRVLYAQGEPEEALQRFQEAVEVNPGYVGAWKDLGTLLYQGDRPEEGIRAYERVAQLSPGDVSAKVTLGVMLHQRGRVEEAVRVYREAVRLDPGHALVWQNLGIAQHALGRVEEAIRAYRQALRLEPNRVTLHNNLAGALYARGGVDEAIQEYRTAIRLDPGNAVAHQNLAIVLAQQKE